jgi:hypothetical protein
MTFNWPPIASVVSRGEEKGGSALPWHSTHRHLLCAVQLGPDLYNVATVQPSLAKSSVEQISFSAPESSLVVFSAEFVL